MTLDNILYYDIKSSKQDLVPSFFPALVYVVTVFTDLGQATTDPITLQLDGQLNSTVASPVGVTVVILIICTRY